MNTTPQIQTASSAQPGHSIIKHFTLADCQPWAGGQGLDLSREDLVECPLSWQKLGLHQTASGYGKKLVTTSKVYFEGKLRRVYCTCFSNVGSLWFNFAGQRIFIIG